jgi:hypothetical protein
VVVNLEEGSATVGQEVYSNGDMIVKDIYGTVHKIPGSNGGYYFPYSCELVTNSESNTTEEGSIYKISFKYATQTPKDTNSTIGSNANTNVSEPTTTITLQMESDTTIGGYSKHGILGGHNRTISFKPLVNTVPVVYYYTNGERIFFDGDFSLEKIGNEDMYMLKSQCSFDVEYEVR